jgi:hypothetical protein
MDAHIFAVLGGRVTPQLEFFGPRHLGGSERLVAWAREDLANERVFWGSIHTKLLPLQVAGDGDAPVVTKLIVQWQQ